MLEVLSNMEGPCVSSPPGNPNFLLPGDMRESEHLSQGAKEKMGPVCWPFSIQLSAPYLATSLSIWEETKENILSF